MLLYNKRLFRKAGLKTDWRPKGWGDIFEAARALNGLDGADRVTPIHFRSEMDDLLPLLAGNGGELWRDGAWSGGTPELGGALGLYEQVYEGGLGDRRLREKSEEEIEKLFADGEIGLMFGSADPGLGKDLGYALIPAAEPGAGVGNRDFVGLSSADLRVVNPASAHPAEAYELFARIMPARGLETGRGELGRFISEKALPVTVFRPPVAEYDRVADTLRSLLDEIVAGKKSAREATADFRREVFKIPG